MRDSISELIIKIKNASTRGLPSITVPYSNMMMSVLEVLEKEGYVLAPAKKGKKVNKMIEVGLVYDEKKRPKVAGVERVSKFSKRTYAGFKDLKPIKSGFGKMILTTPRGIMTDAEAKKLKVGGELLFKIW
jgi:small subunit ribosomal protein S8